MSKIEINKDGNGKWTISFDGNKPSTKYNSLLKLAKALMQYAKGQNL